MFSRQAAGETPTLPEASAQFFTSEVELLIIIFYGILYVLTVYDLLSIKISILGV